MALIIPGPSLLFVRWSCRRCGHSTGVARTTVPVAELADNEDVMRRLYDALRVKLVRKHMLGQGCIASPSDFDLRAIEPNRRYEVLGKI